MSRKMRREPHPFFAAPVTVCAHRGDSARFPENSIPAFEEAVELGVDCLETDIHLSRDGHCVISHDPSVDRTTDASGRIQDFTLREIRSFDAGHRFSPDGGKSFPFRGRGIRIPTLAEALEALPGARFNVDLKVPDRNLAEAFAQTVRGAGAVHRVLAASFHSRPLRVLRSRMPEVATGLSKAEAMGVLLRRATGTLGLGPHPAGLALQVPERYGLLRPVSPAVVRSLHEAGIAVQVWTVNDEVQMMRLFEMGVDGIFTDDPQRMLAALKKRKSR